MLKGSCHCGKITFRLEGESMGIINCHCKACQKIYGNYSALILVPKENFKLDKDETLKWYESSENNKRGFCSNCGSSLFHDNLNSDKMIILAGTIDGPTNLKPIKHIFTDSKGDYYNIKDNN